MSLVGLLTAIALLWLCIHGVSRYLRQQTSGIPAALFPLEDSNAFRRRARRFLGLDSSNTEVALHGVTLRVSTTAWNEPHDRLAAWFLRKRNARVTVLCKAVYDLGTALSVGGMAVGLLGLAWITGNGYKSALWPPAAAAENHSLHRRDLGGPAEGAGAGANSGIVLTPIIPGLTVPLTDLPVIILSVFLSQGVHEFGHAIAAALDSIPVVSSGTSLLLIIPTAFVAFSPASLASLAPRARARIVAAGPFHNLVCWALLIASRVSGLDDYWTGWWYTDVGSIGRGVVSVDNDSPLFGHLMAKSPMIITALDDLKLAGPADVWGRYLLSDERHATDGWCVSTALLGPPSSCCGLAANGTTAACFLDWSQGDDALGCIEPAGVLTKPQAVRCNASQVCPDGQLCGDFDSAKLGLLRITAQFDGATSQVLLWSGPRAEIWEQVRVSRWTRKWRFIGVGILLAIQTFRSYMEMTALSLFFFNLLPIWHLDGTQLLQSLLKIGQRSSSVVIDLENLQERRGAVWQKRIPRIASVVVASLVTLNVVLQIYLLV